MLYSLQKKIDMLFNNLTRSFGALSVSSVGQFENIIVDIPFHSLICIDHKLSRYTCVGVNPETMKNGWDKM